MSLLESAGIDTSVFNAQLIQVASSTLPANLGITTNDILKAADWSTESVFHYKLTDNPSFGGVVLSVKASVQ